MRRDIINVLPQPTRRAQQPNKHSSAGFHMLSCPGAFEFGEISANRYHKNFYIVSTDNLYLL
jgi:hypothetical protein